MDEAQIAKLVLGYLKNGNYKDSYKHFYKQCPHFDIYREKRQRISTRYYGLSLPSMLQQYYDIYSTVQPLLEDTDYYEDRSFSHNELPQQVSYLLSNLKHRSRPSTPCTSISSPTRQNDTGNDPHSHLSSIDLSGSLDITTTPYQSLPGNSRNNGGKFKSPAARHETETEQESSSGEGEKAGIVEVIQTLLGDEDWQETIAHKINKAKTAADLLVNADTFEDLMQEVMGSISEVVEIDRSPQASASSTNSKDTQTQTRSTREVSSSPITSTMNTSDSNRQVIFASTPQTVTTTQRETLSLSEQDIMSMPIFVCEDKLENKVLVEQAVQVPEKRLKTLMPVRKIANVNTADNIVDFITLYNAQDESPTIIQSSNIPYNIAIMEQQEEGQSGQAPNEFGIFSDVKTPDQTAQMPKPPAPTPRSGNRSHVRALDFKFQTTPAKDALRVTQATSASPKTYTNRNKSPGAKSATSKSLFTSGNNSNNNGTSGDGDGDGDDDNGDGKKVNKKEPWDLKFRTALLAAEASNPTPKVLTKASDRKKAAKSPNENIDSTNQRGKGKTGAKAAVAKTTDNTNAATNAKKKKGCTTRKRAKAQACPVNASKAAETNETTPKANKSTKSKVPCVETKEDDLSTVNLINVDRSPLYKTKCNIGNNYAHKSNMKVVLASNAKTNKKDSKGEASTDGAGEKQVLSPSKLNGNRRTLVEADVAESAEATCGMDPSGSLQTPETSKIEPAVVPSSSRMRDLLPLLETPAKDECPKTPCVYDPATAVDTPFTKVFNEQTAGVDLACMPTPKCMLTPNFAFTPLLEGHMTPSYNRPTDYSTSSSYYQPSDTEQNKSLDKLIRECQRLEMEEPEPPAVQLDAVSGSVTASAPVATPPPTTSEGESDAPKADSVNQAVVEKIKSLGSNVIARKNLSLVKSISDKKEDLNSSNSSSASTSGDSSSGSDAEDNVPVNETVVEKADAPRYPLRSRPSVAVNPSMTPTAKPTKTAEDNEDAPDDSDSDDAPLMPDAPHISCPKEKPLSKSLQKEAAKDVLDSVEGKPQPEVKPSPQKEQNDRREKDEQEMIRISEIVNTVSFKPALRESTIKEEGKAKLLNQLEEKRKRVMQGLKGCADDKPAASRRRETAARPPPKKRKSASDGRVLRSSAIKLKEEDLQLTSSDSENEMQPYELVEAVMAASSVSNSPVSENILKQLLMEGQGKAKAFTANSPQHDEIFPMKDDARAEEERKNRKRKVEKADSKEAKETKKLAKKDAKEKDKKVAPKVPIKARFKSSSKKEKEGEKCKEDKEKDKKNDSDEVLEGEEGGEKVEDGHTKNEKKTVRKDEKNDVKIDNKIKVAKQPVETSRSDEELRLLNNVDMMVKVDLSKDIVECTPVQGSTGEEAKSLKEGLEKMGFPVTERVKESNSKANPKQKAVMKVVRYETFVQYPKEEKIAHCLTSLNTPEEDYIYLDTKVFTDPISMTESEVAPDIKRERDIEDDKKRTTKSYKMTVYEDETDAEIEKVMQVTPFESLFEYCVKPVVAPVAPPATPKLAKKKVINVLDDIVVKQDNDKKEQPLIASMKAAIREKQTAFDKAGRNEAGSSQSIPRMERNDNRKGKKGTEREKTSTTITSTKKSEREKEETRDKKRKAENMSNHDDITKKSKVTEPHSLLKGVDLDDMLEEWYKNELLNN